MVEQMSEEGQEGIINKIKGFFKGAGGMAKDAARDATDLGKVNEALKSSENLGLYGNPQLKMDSEEKTQDKEPVASR